MVGKGRTDADGYPLGICAGCGTVYDMNADPWSGCPRCGCEMVEAPPEFGGPNPMTILDELRRGGDTGLSGGPFRTNAEAAQALGYDHEPVTWPTVKCEGCGADIPETYPGRTRCHPCDRMYRQAFDEDEDDISF